MNLQEALHIGATTHNEIRFHQEEQIDEAITHLSTAFGEELFNEIAPDWEGITEWFRLTGDLTKLVLRIEKTETLKAINLIYIRKTANQPDFRLFITTHAATMDQDLDGMTCIDLTNGMSHVPTRDRVCAFLHGVRV